MQGFNLPYQPIPQKLYTVADLFQGYEPGQGASWVKTADFEVYRHFVMEGRTTPANPYMGMMQALHDNAISEATSTFIEGRKVVAIIGDHRLGRNSNAYKNAALIARQLTRDGFLICSGGGPGAMEASHLGSALVGSSDRDLEEALDSLKTFPVVPELGKIIDEKGVIDFSLVSQAEAWFRPAYELAITNTPAGESLAIPTWNYGHEPSTPFATHIAKYFQNSIREEGLVAVAKQGIICMEGKAGTIQEIFQDSTQNFYLTQEQFSPMVLFGVDYWNNSFPVVGVLQKLFQEQFEKYFLVTDQVEAAVQFIENFSIAAGLEIEKLV